MAKIGTDKQLLFFANPAAIQFQIFLKLFISLHENILCLQMPRFKIVKNKGQFGSGGPHIERPYHIDQLKHPSLRGLCVPCEMERPQHDT